MNAGRGDLKIIPGAKTVKTGPAVKNEPESPAMKPASSFAGNQSDSTQRDKSSRFSSVRDSDSRAAQGQAKSAETEKNGDAERAAANESDSSATAETQSLQKEKKFSGRCRLFVGNLPNDLSESEFQKFFEPYGELNEVFLNASRGFGFIRLVSIFHLYDHCFMGRCLLQNTEYI